MKRRTDSTLAVLPTPNSSRLLHSKTMGIFDRIKQGLAKTVSLMQTDIRDIFKSTGRLVDEEFLNEMFEMFVKTDMGVTVSRDITDEIRRQFQSRVAERRQVLAVVKDKLKNTLAQPATPIAFAPTKPTVLMICGVNGSGKTTTIAKLTAMFRAENKSVVLGAADTFRAAAAPQLTIWANRLGAEIVSGQSGSDPASVAHKAVAKALETQADVCIVDTAGRLQTQKNLMQELEKIRRVISKQISDAPHEVLLVLDATTGQNGISQAKHFSETVQCTGLVLAKLDGTAKGGVVVAIRKQMDLPVKFVGIGESAEDLAIFDAGEFVDALFDEAANPTPAEAGTLFVH